MMYATIEYRKPRTSFLQKRSKKPSSPGELLGLQALRGVACLMVAAFHAVEGLGRGQWPNGSGGVDLFFVISGLVMFTSSRRLAVQASGWRTFLARRLARIVPLYWLLTLAKTGITLAAPHLAPATQLTAWNTAASFLFIPARDAAGIVRPVLPVGWTLEFEMLFYLVFAAALALRRNPLAILLPVLLPLGLAGFWRAADWPAIGFLANGLVLELCAGVALAECHARGWRPNAAVCTFLLAGGSALLITLPSFHAWRCLAWGVPATCIVAGTVGLEQRLRPHLPALALALGDASYAIYLSHVFVIPAVAAVVGRLGPAGPWRLAVQVAASLVVCAAAGMAVHAAVDAPIQAWLHRRRQPGRTAVAQRYQS